MPHLKCNGDANIENAVKKIEYPEHKLKSREGIVLKDLNKNVEIINNLEDFYQEMNSYEQDRRIVNFERKHHKNRTLSEEEFREKILKKGVATTYTLQENHLFFKQKFNNEPRKIQEYYELFLECFLEEANIPKSKVINAIIHFDQTNPHLHFAISNIHEKYSKEHERMVKTVNKEKYKLFEHLIENKKQDYNDYLRWCEFRKMRDKYYNHEVSQSDWQAYMDKNYNVGILSNVEKRLNQKYEKKYGKGLYLNREDYIYMSDVRGFSNKDILDLINKRSHTEKYKSMENNIILKSRETAINNELFNFKYKRNPMDDMTEAKMRSSLYWNANDKLFEEYINGKFNKLYATFVLEMNKEFKASQEKRILCKAFGLDYRSGKQIEFEEAISNVNELILLNKIALDVIKLTQNMDLKEQVMWLDREESIILETFGQWMNRIEYSFIPDEWKKEFKNLEKNQIGTFRKMACNVYEITTGILDDLNKNIDFEQRLEKNWYFKYEKNLLERQYQNLLDSNLNKAKPMWLNLELTSYEKRLMFKKVLQERIDFDLKTLNMYKSFKQLGLNNIERMREYNKILSYCAHRQLQRKQEWELKSLNLEKRLHAWLTYEDPAKEQILETQRLYQEYKKGASFTPQDLAKELYFNEWKPLNFKQELNLIETNKELEQDEKELQISQLENLKEIEYSILKTDKTFSELKQEYEEQSKEQELSFEEFENEYLDQYLDLYQMELKMEARELVHDAKELNNWFEFDDLEQDFKTKEFRQEWTMEKVEEYARILQEDYGQELKSQQQLNQSFSTIGIDIDFVNQLNEELTLDMSKAYKNKEQYISFPDKSRDLDLSEKYSSFFAFDESGDYLEKEQRMINQRVFEYQLKHVIALAKKGCEITSICHSLKISEGRIYQALKVSKERKQERNEQVLELVLDDDLSL